MWLSRLRNWIRSPRCTRLPGPKPLRTRLKLEKLEERALPSNYTAASVSDLIADINAANQAGGNNTITLAANTIFNLTAVNNTTNGANGLPIIAKKDNLSIAGQGGDIIQRDTAAPAFRLIDVVGGGSLTLADVTLQNGLAFGSGSAADGGAIYNQGNLVLNGVTVQANTARGSDGSGSGKNANGQDAAGGGIWSSSALTLGGGTLVQSNQALGGAAASSGTAGGDALGGGLYIAGGTANLTGVTVSDNSVVGGHGVGACLGGCQLHGPAGGNGIGGGLYVAAGAAVTLCSDMVKSNAAYGAYAAPVGGEGGGIYIAPKTTVYLDAFTVANTINNTASNLDPNIDGSYIIQPC